MEHLKPAPASFRVFWVLTLLFVTSGTWTEAAANPDSGPAEWSVTLGAGVLYNPDYPGSDDLETQAIPWIDAQYGDMFFARFPDGIGVNLLREAGLTAGVAIGYGGGRDDEGDLEPLEEVDNGALGKAFVSYQLGAFEIETTFAQALSGDNNGQSVKLGVSLGGRLHPQWIYSAGTSLQWNSDDWNDALFSLSASEAARIGTAPFSGSGGISEVGISGMLTYLWNRQVTTTLVAGVSRLLGDAADSPIVDDLGRPTQPLIILVTSYRF
jgi:outer membrane protein